MDACPFVPQSRSCLTGSPGSDRHTSRETEVPSARASRKLRPRSEDGEANLTSSGNRGRITRQRGVGVGTAYFPLLKQPLEVKTGAKQAGLCLNVRGWSLRPEQIREGAWIGPGGRPGSVLSWALSQLEPGHWAWGPRPSGWGGPGLGKPRCLWETEAYPGVGCGVMEGTVQNGKETESDWVDRV